MSFDLNSAYVYYITIFVSYRKLKTIPFQFVHKVESVKLKKNRDRKSRDTVPFTYIRAGFAILLTKRQLCLEK